jgi:hypothetical protein
MYLKNLSKIFIRRNISVINECVLTHKYYSLLICGRLKYIITLVNENKLKIEKYNIRIITLNFY